MNVNLDVKSRAQNIFPKEIVPARFFDGAFEDSRALREFASYVDVSGARVQRVT